MIQSADFEETESVKNDPAARPAIFKSRSEMLNDLPGISNWWVSSAAANIANKIIITASLLILTGPETVSNVSIARKASVKYSTKCIE